MMSRIRSVTSHTLTFIPATTRPSREPERDELARVQVAAHDDSSSVGVRVPDVLHAEVVLVGEEVRAAGRRRRPGRASTAPRPPAGAARSPSARRGCGAPATGGTRWRRHRRRRRRGSLLRRLASTSDAVVHVQPGRAGEVDVRADPDADDDRVRRDDAAVAELDARHGRRAPADGGDGHAEPQVDAVLPVQAGEHLPPSPDRARRSSGSSALSSTVTVAPAPRAAAAVSRPIQPAPITTTFAAGPERRAQRVAVVERAQVVHARQVGAGQPQVARRRAGGEEQPVVAHRLAVVGHELVGVPVEPGDRRRPAAGRRRARRTSPPGGRTRSRARRCPAGSPSTAAAARRGGAARRRTG